MKKSKFIDSLIIGVLKQAEAGTHVPQPCQTHGISTATFCKWRSKFGGMDVSMVSRLMAEARSLREILSRASVAAAPASNPESRTSDTDAGGRFFAHTQHTLLRGLNGRLRWL